MHGIYTYQELFNMSCEELIEWLFYEINDELPIGVSTIEEANAAAELLGVLAGKYTYLMELSSVFKAKIREERRNGDKEAVDSLIDKKEAIVNATNAVHLKYKALNRMVNIRSDNMRELFMTNGTI